MIEYVTCHSRSTNPMLKVQRRMCFKKGEKGPSRKGFPSSLAEGLRDSNSRVATFQQI